jgi:hypothetical protein
LRRLESYRHSGGNDREFKVSASSFSKTKIIFNNFAKIFLKILTYFFFADLAFTSCPALVLVVVLARLFHLSKLKYVRGGPLPICPVTEAINTLRLVKVVK